MLVRVLALVFGFLAVGAQAADVPSPWEAGKQYFVIDPPVRSDAGGKIEVTSVTVSVNSGALTVA